MMDKGKRIVSGLCKFWGIALIVGIIAVCIPLTVPRLLGYEIYDVISGSMEPTISVGSIVYAKQIMPEEIVEGDIIVYYGEQMDGAIITHRVVENDVITGRFITKGDANKQKDPMPVAYESYIGKAGKVVPYMGHISAIMTTLYGKITAACLVLLALILHTIGDILDSKRKEETFREDTE